AVYDNNGVKHVSYTYDAWGNTTETRHANYTAASYNPFRYRGYYYDRDIGLYCLGTRWYSSQFRRFLSPDDISYLGANGDLNSYNLYAYCSNNPVMFTDPTGHFGIALTLLIATAIGMAISTGIEVVKQVYNEGAINWDLRTWNWWGIGAAALTGAATGLAYGLGGVAGGIVKGSFSALSIAGKTLSISQSIGVLLGTTVLTNFAVGVGGYALHTIGSTNENFSLLKGISKGIRQVGKGGISFFTGGMFVGAGGWNVGVGAQNTFSSMVGRAMGKFVANYIPNAILETLF
ncbi:MAG: RHS repeat-associated core domain-containing protein, partial [Clostridia bacterium]|nr:RHS repeat-associated core domain-containing protein [Clostridia bacterium]